MHGFGRSISTALRRPDLSSRTRLVRVFSYCKLAIRSTEQFPNVDTVGHEFNCYLRSGSLAHRNREIIEAATRKHATVLLHYDFHFREISAATITRSGMENPEYE
jgi:hypothetical protein